MLHRKKASNSYAIEAVSRSTSDKSEPRSNSVEEGIGEAELRTDESAERASYRSALTGLAAETAVLILFLFVIFRFFFGVTVQHGNSMYPAIKDGDIIFYYRASDLVNTEACVYTADGEIHTGRIAASEGTLISSTGDMQLTFNGIYLPPSPSAGIYDRTYAAEQEILPVTVGEECFFILGDNRGESEDSRVYGQISRKNICGRIIAVLRRRQI